jgi:hypothetical protein
MGMSHLCPIPVSKHINHHVAVLRLKVLGISFWNAMFWQRSRRGAQMPSRELANIYEVP